MKSTIDFESLMLFRTVVEAKSFTRAGEMLHKDKAHVSRVISRLERNLGVLLLRRSTRSLHVTEIGAEFYERAVLILEAVAQTEASIDRSKGEPRGSLSISSGGEFGQLVVNQWVREYLRRYPKVRIRAEYSNRNNDIIHEGIDVAIRVGPLTDSDLSARFLGNLTYGVYASPGYVSANASINDPKDLGEHPLVMFAPQNKVLPWMLVNGKERVTVSGDPMVTVNNMISVCDLVVDGLGLSVIPHFQAKPHVLANRLTQVLPQWSRVPIPVSAVFASSRYITPKVRAFIDLAIKFMEEVKAQ